MALPTSALLDDSLAVAAAPWPCLAGSARFSDGPAHVERRAEAVAALPPVDGLRTRATELAGRDLGDDVEVVALALRIPVTVLAEAMGLSDVTDRIGALCATGTDPGLDLARASLLFQCRDATAALIAATLLGDRRPPVHLTRRVDAAGVVHDVSLVDAPFGAGRHACPGRDHAEALATGVVEALSGWHVVDVGPLEDRPNLRLPTWLRMAR